VLAGHSQKGIPAFSIYGHDVQDGTDKSIPADVQEKNSPLRPRRSRRGLDARANRISAWAASRMGIAGSIVDQPFFEELSRHAGETIDMTEFLRRMDKGILIKPNTRKRLSGPRKLPRRQGLQLPQTTRSRTQLDSEWEKSVKMALIARDLMVGNPKLAEMGFGEEAHGHNAIASGFQGQRQ